MNNTINNNKVIIINGVACSGKDTFVKQCNTLNSKVMHTSIVNKIKDIAKYCGWDGEKTEKNRKFLSDLKDILSEWDDIPFKSIDKFIISCKNKLIFIDARESNDIDRLKNEYNGVTLLIKNDRVKPITSNHADANLEDYNYDYIIYNNGSIENLKDSAEVFLEEIIND